MVVTVAHSWAGKRVLVTGAGGFIGSHLTEALVRQGARTRAFCRYSSSNSRQWLGGSDLASDIEFVYGDIRDVDSVHGAMRNVDIVFHLAALIAIPYSYDAPRSYVETNITGTLNALMMARQFEVERFVGISTSEVYGTARSVPIDESHPLQGQSPYSATKIGADALIEAFRRSYGLRVVTARPFNTYGPRQSARAIVPAIVTQALQSGEIRLGNLTPTRDLTYVADTVQGLLALASAPSALCEVLNLGTGHEISIVQLARLICEIVGCEPRIQSDAGRMRRPGSEVERLCADISKAKRLTGWVPEHPLREGLTATVDWMRNHLRHFRVDEYVK